MNDTQDDVEPGYFGLLQISGMCRITGGVLIDTVLLNVERRQCSLSIIHHR